MLSVTTFILAVAATASALFFGALTMGNPYSDLEKAYSTLAFLGSCVVAVVCWVLFAAPRLTRWWRGEGD